TYTYQNRGNHCKQKDTQISHERFGAAGACLADVWSSPYRGCASTRRRDTHQASRYLGTADGVGARADPRRKERKMRTMDDQVARNGVYRVELASGGRF